MLVDICDFCVRKHSEEMVETIWPTYTKGPLEESSDALGIYRMQMSEFRRRCQTLESVGDDPLLTWLYFFDRGHKSEGETEMLAQRSPGMRDLARRYERAITDPAVVSRYDDLEDGRCDYASGITFAKDRLRGTGAKRTPGLDASGPTRVILGHDVGRELLSHFVVHPF